jgi:hypothetical protein
MMSRRQKSFGIGTRRKKTVLKFRAEYHKLLEEGQDTSSFWNEEQKTKNLRNRE